jgi:hypothetical protein
LALLGTAAHLYQYLFRSIWYLENQINSILGVDILIDHRFVPNYFTAKGKLTMLNFLMFVHALPGAIVITIYSLKIIITQHIVAWKNWEIYLYFGCLFILFFADIIYILVYFFGKPFEKNLTAIAQEHLLKPARYKE